MQNTGMKNLQTFLITFLTGITSLTMSCNRSVNQQNENTYDEVLTGKKVLYVYGGWEGHEPEQCRDIFVPWLESEGAEVFVFDNLSCYTDSALMERVDLVIQHFTQGEITHQQERALLGAVHNGTGLAGWHGGTGDSFRSNVEFQYMVGGPVGGTSGQYHSI